MSVKYELHCDSASVCGEVYFEYGVGLANTRALAEEEGWTSTGQPNVRDDLRDYCPTHS